MYGFNTALGAFPKNPGPWIQVFISFTETPCKSTSVCYSRLQFVRPDWCPVLLKSIALSSCLRLTWVKFNMLLWCCSSMHLFDKLCTLKIPFCTSLLYRVVSCTLVTLLLACLFILLWLLSSVRPLLFYYWLCLFPLFHERLTTLFVAYNTYKL